MSKADLEQRENYAPDALPNANKSVAKQVSQESCNIEFPSESGVASFDPVVHDMLQREKARQVNGIELIASENFTSRAVLECLGSCTTNKYSEGVVGRRYYGGNEVIDEIEELCIERALEAFNLESDKWCVNVQPYSGSPANAEVYLGLLEPGDRILGLSLNCGGHLSHGFQGPVRKFTSCSTYYNTDSYGIGEHSHEVIEEELRAKVAEFKPHVLIAGGSAYSRKWDWEMFRRVADEFGARLLVDMAHIAGLVATGLHPSPFPFADVVTTTTHKTLRGPRGAMIFMNKDRLGMDMVNAINRGVFPGLQGGPHNNQITALCTQLKEVLSPVFREYQEKVIANAKIMEMEFKKLNYELVAGGTDNHLLVVNTLKTQHVTGSKVEYMCSALHISINKNTVPGDTKPMSPSGIRIGSPAMTSRGATAEDFKTIVLLVHKAIQLSWFVQESICSKSLDLFKKAINTKTLSVPNENRKQLSDGGMVDKMVRDGLSLEAMMCHVIKEVQDFSSKLSMPGGLEADYTSM